MLFVQLRELVPGLIVLHQLVESPAAKHTQAFVLPCDLGALVQGIEGLAVLPALELGDRRLGQLAGLRAAAPLPGASPGRTCPVVCLQSRDRRVTASVFGKGLAEN